MQTRERPRRVNTVRAAQLPTLTVGRLTVVIIIGAALLLTLALPLREFLNQRNTIAGLEAKTTEQTDRVAQLEDQAENWQDDDYVQSQARERLRYQFPGETGYVVTDPPPEAVATDERQWTAETPGSWYERAWSQVQQAQQPAEAPVVEVRPDAPR